MNGGSGDTDDGAEEPAEPTLNDLLKRLDRAKVFQTLTFLMDDSSDGITKEQLKRFGISRPTFLDRLDELASFLDLKTGFYIADARTTRNSVRLESVAHELGAALRDGLHDLFDRLKDKDAWLNAARYPEIVVSCFNSPMRNFVAAALAPLRLGLEDFPYSIRFDRIDTYQDVNPAVLLDDTDRHQLRYAVVSWPSLEPNQRLESGSSPFAHYPLYTWTMVVIADDQHEFIKSGRESVELDEVLTELSRDRRNSLLVSPHYHSSRRLLDDALEALGKLPRPSAVLENPDTFTRVELARRGFGIAIAPADAIPAREPTDRLYPVLTNDGVALQGRYTLSWRKHGGGAPAGILPEHHQRIVESFQTEIHDNFVRRHPHVEHPVPWPAPGDIPVLH